MDDFQHSNTKINEYGKCEKSIVWEQEIIKYTTIETKDLENRRISEAQLSHIKGNVDKLF